MLRATLTALLTPLCASAAGAHRYSTDELAGAVQVSTHAQPSPRHGWWRHGSSNAVLRLLLGGAVPTQNLLVCVEMGLLFAFANNYAFTADPYAKRAAAIRKSHTE